MRVRVMKFGGASVATPSCFNRIAEIILRKSFEPTIVVVSAMGKTTDQLIDLAQQVHPNPPKRELDMLVSTGERVSISLLAMALRLKGAEAVSFTGSQSGIITTNEHSEAKIVDVRPKRLKEALQGGRIGIVAGFQGMSLGGEITTLGRGGSDTTAVALAAAIGAEAVEFYKDVPGIFTSDPKSDPEARLLRDIDYLDALGLVRQGAKVLHSRSIELAAANGIQLHVIPFDDPNQVGTVVGKQAVRRTQIVYETGESR